MSNTMVTRPSTALSINALLGEPGVSTPAPASSRLRIDRFDAWHPGGAAIVAFCRICWIDSESVDSDAA